MKYQPITITLPAATYGSLERAVFNKRRVADHAVEKLRVALLSMFPPRTPEEWKDKSRTQGAGRYVLLLYYDLARHLLRKWMGRGAKLEAHAAHTAGQSHQLTLMIPAGFMGWIEEVARGRQVSISEATAYAVEYGMRVLESQGGAAEVGQKLRRAWGDVLRAVWKR